MQSGNTNDKALGDAVRTISNEIATPFVGDLALHIDERLDQIIAEQAAAKAERKALADRLLAIELALTGRDSRAVGGGDGAATMSG